MLYNRSLFDAAKIRKSKAFKELQKAQQIVGGDIRISKRGVPHLKVQDHSMCYFASTKKMKVFDKYATGEKQNKWHFDSAEAAAEFLVEKGVSENLSEPMP